MAYSERKTETPLRNRRKKLEMLGKDGNFVIRQSPCALNLSGSKVNFYSVKKRRPNSNLRNIESINSSFAACSPVEIFQYTGLRPNFQPSLVQGKKDLFDKVKLAVLDEKIRSDSVGKRSRFSSPNARNNNSPFKVNRKATVSLSRQKMYAEKVNFLINN